jgi:dehydrogenase/reductase SDR family protein 7
MFYKFIFSFYTAIGKKSGITDADVMILPVDITNLDLHQQYFESVIHHFGTVDKSLSKR